MLLTRYQALTLAVIASMQQVAFAQSHQYNIGVAPLSQTMALIARQNGVSLSADPALLTGKTAPAIRGNYTVDIAFNLALAGSGLQLIKNTDGTVYSLKITQNQDKSPSVDIGLLKTIETTASQSGNRHLTQLPVITVNAEKNGRAEEGYLVENITGAGIWGKRSLQDTPYSMTVIPQELIENVQANDMAKIFKMNPLTQDGGDQLAGNYSTVIRGFNSNNAVINGLPLADFYSFTTMEDLERVETISGATGFLYGGGRVGGAVNYVIKKPTLTDKKSIKLGSYGGDQYYGHIDVSGQIDPENIFGYRVNALYQDGESTADVGKEQKFLSLAFDYKPNDHFVLDFNYAHRDLTKTNVRPMFVINTYRPKIEIDKGYFADWTALKEKNDRLMSSLKWDINETFTLRSSLIYEKSDRKILGNQYIYTRPDKLYDVVNRVYPSQAQEIENYAGNIFLDSKFQTLGIDHLLSMGYSENYFEYRVPAILIKDESFTAITFEQLKHLASPKITVPDSALVKSWKTQYSNLLIGDDITFNAQWSALIGMNYATVRQTNYSSGIRRPSYEKSELTPTLSLIYKPISNVSTYATYIESLEQGTIVDSSYSNPNEILPPLVSKQYEVGAKYNLNENLLLTAALFRIKKANQYSDLAHPISKYVQDGEQIHQGLEFTMTGKLTDHLTIMGGGTWMDLSVEKSNNKALEGNKPTNAASEMAKIYAEYAVPEIQGLTLSGGAYYTGKKYGNASNTDEIPAYTLFDLGGRYTTIIAQHPTTFNFTISNVTGKNYWASGSYLGDPRTVAFSVKTQF